MEAQEQESGAFETVNTENADLSEAQNRAIGHWDSAHQYRRKTIIEAWNCGQALSEVQEKLPRGEWRKWLESVRIPKSTAYLWMRFSKNYELSKIGHFNSVNQALKALPPDGSKRKEEVEPDVEKKGEALSVQQEEVTDGEVGTRQLSDEIESTLEIQELPDKLSETEPVGEKETAELRETKDQLREAEKKNTDLGQENADLRQENDRLKRLLEENGIPWKSTPDDQYTQAA